MAKGTKRATIADVARLAEVSKMTVSRVINHKPGTSEATRQRVMRAVESLGFRPHRVARALATDKSFVVGIIVPNITNSFFASFVQGAEVVLWEHEYTVLLCNTDRNPQREQVALRVLEDNRADGIIICGSYLPDEDLHVLSGSQRPLVCFNCGPRDAPGAIWTDERAAMREGIEFLMARGRRNLGYVGIMPEAHIARERLEGFRQVLGGGSPELICTSDLVEDNDLHIAAWLGDNPSLVGLNCFSDRIASSALRACHLVGRRVPDDVGIIGSDDLNWAGLITPPLTTLRTTLTQMEIGEVASRRLLKQIEGGKPPPPMTLPPQLIIRATTP